MIEIVAMNPASSVELRAIGRLRVEAWRALVPTIAQVFPDGCWLDHHDAHAHHFVATEDGRPVASGRLCVHRNANEIHPLFATAPAAAPYGYISRLAVDPAARRSRLASLIDEARTRAALASSCGSILACWSSLSGGHRLASLRDQGFAVFSTVPDANRLSDRERFQWLVRPLPGQCADTHEA
jgi:GNAT superfamily N-acetyltransferase